MTIYSLDVLLFLFGTNLCYMSSSNCCLLTSISVYQETGQMVWYFHLFKRFPQFIVIHKSNNRMWSTGEGNGKPLHYSCLENPTNIIKTQKYRALKDELPRPVVPNMLLEICGEITPERMKGWSQSKNNTQLWM